ncbi:diguanylate cyclase [Clostridium sp. MCC353]|uniref:sensor domain-containing diguanylate cyclase n=1 Tax=Clostridium sp. MCC353 TaxID=2592646 RepID=UPI001C022737|nr:diguanylate cyclase [Clostridium sp. MCC353]MBT9779885.1 diguanylate cyclase [Clostridium sp. MCC353]
MYRYLFNIVILSETKVLGELLSQVPPPEGVDCVFSTIGSADRIETVKADLIILDSPFSQYECDGKVIICLETEEMESFAAKRWESIFDIWLKPFNEKLIALRFRHILEHWKLEKTHRFSEQCMDTLLECIPDMVWFKDLEGLHVKVNDAFCNIVGKPKGDVTGKDHCYIWDVSREEFEKGQFVCKETDEYVLTHRQKCKSTEAVKSQHGMRQFNTYKAPLIDEGGRIMGSVGIGHDITDLENKGAEMEIILRSMPFGILVWNEEGRVINANSKFEEYFNVSGKDIIGKSYEAWSYKTLGGETLDRCEGYREVKIQCDKDDIERLLELHEEPIYDVFQNEIGRICIYRDITMERAMEQQILRNSNTDFLTGLNNRRSLYRFLGENKEEATFSLLYLDLDHFKGVNDNYGHQAGDEALIMTARLMQECFPEEFIARIGGDEFLIAILGKKDIGELTVKSQKLLGRMREEFTKSPCWKELSASVGIAQAEGKDLDIDELIRHSDSALYAAKEAGRARVCVYQGE